MAVKKAKDASFKRMDSAYASSKSAIQKVKNADPLNAKEEQEQEEGNASVDPANYLSKKEKKEWKRLSYTAKQRYIRQAERQLKRQKAFFKHALEYFFIHFKACLKNQKRENV